MATLARVTEIIANSPESFVKSAQKNLSRDQMIYSAACMPMIVFQFYSFFKPWMRLGKTAPFARLCKGSIPRVAKFFHSNNPPTQNWIMIFYGGRPVVFQNEGISAFLTEVIFYFTVISRSRTVSDIDILNVLISSGVINVRTILVGTFQPKSSFTTLPPIYIP